MFPINDSDLLFGTLSSNTQPVSLSSHSVPLFFLVFSVLHHFPPHILARELSVRTPMYLFPFTSNVFFLLPATVIDSFLEQTNSLFSRKEYLRLTNCPGVICTGFCFSGKTMGLALSFVTNLVIYHAATHTVLRCVNRTDATRYTAAV